MLKLLFIFALNILNISNISDGNYGLITEEVDSQKEIIEEVEDYSIIYNNGFYLENSTGLSYKLENVSDPKLYIKDNKVYVIYTKESKLSVIEFNGNKLIKEEIVIFDNKVIPDFEFIESDGMIYIAATVMEYSDKNLIELRDKKGLNQKDCLLLKYDLEFNLIDFNIYGGKYDEKFIDIICTNNDLYLVASKMGLSGGDFGNGGNTKEVYVICRIDKNLDLINYLTFKESLRFSKIIFYNEYLYISFNKCLYKYNYDLTSIYKYNYPQMIKFTLFSTNNEILIIGEKTSYLLNLDDLNIKYQFELNLNYNYFIKELENKIYLYHADKSYYLDIYNLEDLIFRETYKSSDEDEIIVKSLFGQVKIEEKNSDIVFNGQVFGQYQISYKLVTSGKLNFIIEATKTVEMEANVEEGGIYPTGYQLLFTGVAKLNGVNIINNYPIMNEGNYKLELQSANGEVEVINFLVDRNQYIFQDNKLKQWDFEKYKNSVYYLDFYLNNINDYEIKGVLINNLLYDEFQINDENNLLKLKMKSPGRNGIYNYYVESIIYYDKEYEREYKIKKDYTLNVLKDAPIISLNNNDNQLGVEIDCIDNDQTFRYFEVIISNNTNEIVKKYPISDSFITLENLKEDINYNVIISLVYNLGNNTKNAEEIANFKIIAKESVVNLGNIEINRRSDKLESFSLKVDEDNKDSIFQLSSGLVTIYIRENSNYNMLIFSIFLLFSTFFATIIIKKKLIK